MAVQSRRACLPEGPCCGGNKLEASATCLHRGLISQDTTSEVLRGLEFTSVDHKLLLSVVDQLPMKVWWIMGGTTT
jgi:hypothetical protein